MAALTAITPTAFTDVTAGSRVRINSAQSPPSFEPYEANVIEMRPEYGPNVLPALILSGQPEGSPGLVMGDGTTKIVILLNAKALQTSTPPAGTIRAQTIPRSVEAIRFAGGPENATCIIQLTAGLLNIRWEQATDQHAERMVATTIAGESPINLGDYIVRSDSKVWVETTDSWANGFEVVA